MNAIRLQGQMKKVLHAGVAAAAFVLAAALITACGTPRPLVARNLTNATITPLPVGFVPSATAQPTHEHGPIVPTRPPMTVVVNLSETPEVALYKLLGTPTPTPTRQGEVAVVPTATVSAEVVAPTATVSVEPTAGPTTEPTIAPTEAAPTSAPTEAAGPTQPAATDAGVAAPLPKGDAARGKTIFSGVGTCRTCHDVARGIQITGPTLKGISTRAVTRKPGMKPEEYLRESITAPNAYVVKGFSPGIMPQNFNQLLKPQQIADLIAYLQTLK